MNSRIGCNRLCGPRKIALFYSVVLLICLSATLPVSADEVNLTCQGFEIGAYASISLCLPPFMVVEQGNVTEMNYTQGCAVIMPLDLNGSQAALHLLYPCNVQGDLNLSWVYMEISAFDPEMGLALYNTAPLNISDRPALWGMVRNQTFAAYSPSNRTAALLIFEEGTPDTTVNAVLSSMHIAVSQTVLPEMFCAPTWPPVPAIPSVDANQNLPGDITDHGPEAEARLERIEATKERLLEDMESAKERLNLARERLEGFGNIPGPFIHP